MENGKYLKLLLFLIPIAGVYLLSLVLMSPSDAGNMLYWYVTLLVFGLGAMPLTFSLFKKFNGGCAFLSKIIGILSVAVTIWLLTYIKIYRFNQLTILITLLLLFLASYGIPGLRKNFTDKLNEILDNNWKTAGIVFEEVLFVVIFTLMCFFKGFLPDINGQEKFMDYGFIMSMLRSDVLPANDMWLSGESINYYYFGQYIYALIIKFIGIDTGVGYNLAMCTSTALPFMSAYVIGTQLVELSSAFGVKNGKVSRTLVGIFSGCAVSLWGNSHSFFYDSNSVGNGILKFLSEQGVNVGKTNAFFYPESTRYIGHNPDSMIIDELTGKVISNGDYTIHEFPFYSYLVGDLHAHVISMIVVLLIIAVMIALIYEITDTVNSGRNQFTTLQQTARNFFTPYVITDAVLLGIAMQTNYWDFLIYFVFSAMAFLVFYTLTSDNFAGAKRNSNSDFEDNQSGFLPKTILDILGFIAVLALILIEYVLFSEKVIIHAAVQALLFAAAFMVMHYNPSALSKTAATLSFLFASSNIIAVPFNYNFDMISNKIALCQNHSSPFQFTILWGVHILISVILIICTIFGKNYVSVKVGKKEKKVVVQPSCEPHNPIAKFFAERNPADVFVSGMAVTGLLMLIAPEVFYVRDIYTGGYLRSNTMFKFTFAGFIILSLVMIYTVNRLFYYTNKEGGYSNVHTVISIVLVVLLFIPGHYTMLSLKQRSGDLILQNFKTLDGTAYIDTYVSPYVNIGTAGNLKDYKNTIDWFNENVEGDPVIVEAWGYSYTDRNIVSAYTGLPTVIGWQTHEQLWRFHGIVDEETNLLVSDPENDVWKQVLTPRQTDVLNIYTCTNPTTVRAILNKYNVTYIINGSEEFAAYNFDNSICFNQIAEPVFTDGSVTVYKVNDN